MAIAPRIEIVRTRHFCRAGRTCILQAAKQARGGTDHGHDRADHHRHVTARPLAGKSARLAVACCARPGRPAPREAQLDRGRGEDDQPRPPGRRRARRLRLGRARPAARGGADRLRGHQRHQRRRHERGRARLRPDRGRARGRAARSPISGGGSATPRPSARCSPRCRPADGNHALENSPAFLVLDLVTRLFSPYQFNPAQLQSAARRARAVGRLRALRSALPGQAVPVGHQRAHRQDQGLRQARDHAPTR